MIVVDPRKVRVIAETKHKTDKTDARILADLLRTGALPKPVWQAPQSTRELRDQVRLRWGLVRKRANLTLRARSLLSSVGINLGKRAFASQATWERVLKRRDVRTSRNCSRSCARASDSSASRSRLSRPSTRRAWQSRWCSE